MKPKSLFENTPESSPQTTPPQPTPRLEGDDLYLWAKLVSDMEHAQRALNEFGQATLRNKGFDRNKYALTNDGYIVQGTVSGVSEDAGFEA